MVRLHLASAAPCGTNRQKSSAAAALTYRIRLFSRGRNWADIHETGGIGWHLDPHSPVRFGEGDYIGVARHKPRDTEAAVTIGKDLLGLEFPVRGRGHGAHRQRERLA